jgi:hypothetical protein
MAVIRGPRPYNEFKQRVRRFRRSDVLRECAHLNNLLEQQDQRKIEPLNLPRHVQQFSVGGIARTALASGNENRPKGMAVRDVVDLCWWYVNVNEPKDDTPHGRDHLRQMLARVGYEQFRGQLSAMEEVGRSLVLFEDYGSTTI